MVRINRLGKIRLMARITRRRYGAVTGATASMATLAVQGCVRTRQREFGQAMVKPGAFPLRRAVTNRAIL